MNRFYHIVFNRALGLFQVASETTRAQGKTGGGKKRPARRTARQLPLAIALTLAAGSLPALAFDNTGSLVGTAGGDSSGATGGTGAVTSGAYANGGGNGSLGDGEAGSGAAGSGGAGGLSDPVSATLGKGGGGGNLATHGVGGGGGAGGGLAGVYTGDGGGGGGDLGYAVGAGGTLNNLGTITGGAGGTGGYVAHAGIPGGGGGGGAGVFAGAGSTIVNSGTIAGGAGGAGGAGVYNGGGGVGLIVTGNTSITNSGTISGAGGARAIELGGGGNTLTLQAGSNISGNVVSIDGGDTLALGGSTNSSFNMSTVGASTQYQGFDSFEKTGTSTWTLTGANTFSGATTVSAGTLQAGNTGSFSASSATTVASGATLDLNNIDQSIGSLAGSGSVTLGSATLTAGSDDTSTTFSGVISGTGGLTKTGTGTMILSGANNHTGTTMVSAGTLQAGAANALSSSSKVWVGSGATFDLNSLNQTVGSLIGSGNVTLGTATLTAGSDNSSTLFAGVISGTGSLVKTGSGTLTLSSTSSGLFGGATTVQAGTLNFADGAWFTGSAVNVQSGAFLTAGNAAIDKLTNAGTASVGAGKLLSIDGNFTNTGRLITSVAGTSSYGQITVGGTATLTGSTLHVDVTNGEQLAIGNLLVDVIRANAIVGEFASVTDNSRLFNFAPVYNDTHLDLSLVADDSINAETIVRSHNNRVALRAARAWDRAIAADPHSELSNRLSSLSGDSQVNDGVMQSLPLLAGGSQFAAGAAQTGINRVIQARLDANQGLSSGDEFLKDNHLWLKGFGSWADQNDRNGVSGYDANVGGLAIGMDGNLSDKLLLGASFAYANASVDGNSDIAKNKVDVDVYQLLGYGSYSLDNATEINFQLGTGVNKNQSKRELSVFNLNAKADYSSVTALAGVGLGHTITLNEQLRFTPSVRADYTWVKDKGYTETGADVLNLKVNNRDTDSLIVAADGKLNYAFNSSTNVSANFGVGYDTLNDRTSITSAYAGAPGAAFTTEGLDLDPWLLRAGVGLSHNTNNGTEISFRYDAEKRNDFLNQTASVKVRWAF